ncbi:multicopper oxidase domain-containing protein [Streptomyces sp. NPDC097704]|uniref:multicopper oxidase domain-containing protein n=1 Tax=Streptomyces sp. NPDC097704 TaxID=3157101 RepID=UPI00331B970C
MEETLGVRFTDVSVPGHGRITTRTCNGTIPGPTLRVRGGQTLRLTHVNGLPPNPPRTGGHSTPHHPAGTYWYHPHLHGAIAEQIVGGMAGVIVVEGDVDEVPEIRAAADLVVCVNELKVKDGEVPALTSGGWVIGVPSVFTVNGTANPTLRLRPGEVQRWRPAGTHYGPRGCPAR